MPFDDSRRLTGANLYFTTTGAVLEIGTALADDALLAGWRSRVERARAALGWPADPLVARRHQGGASLAIGAPADLLFTATEVNEWALCATLWSGDPAYWHDLPAMMHAALLEDAADPATVIAPILAEEPAIARLAVLAAREQNTALRSLIVAADARRLNCVVDDTQLTLGAGAGSRSYPTAALPATDDVPWHLLGDVPTALVTGSNGKTTTVRLVAACVRAHGRVDGYNCTDGVYIAGEEVDVGDYSGPAGARLVLRDHRTQAAVLETARGGILRRGLAVTRADVAIVTNVSSDHFGEYGIHDLAGLTDVKLTVAAVLGTQGLLVLNADDPQLAARAATLPQRFQCCPRVGWFAADADHPQLVASRAQGLPSAGVRAGNLHIHDADGVADLGPVSAMPLTVQGSATYNIGNLAGAALVARALGVPAATIAGVFARFGASPRDNSGRLMRYDTGGVRVLVDYAHNPAGLRGLLAVAQHVRSGRGRLGLLLGHAGNRQDQDLEALAAVAAEFRPDLVVIKENEAQLRGRAPGEVPALLAAALARCGLPDGAVQMRMSELDAARAALDWALPGDVLALPVHSARARAAVVAMLERAVRDADGAA